MSADRCSDVTLPLALEIRFYIVLCYFRLRIPVFCVWMQAFPAGKHVRYKYTSGLAPNEKRQLAMERGNARVCVSWLRERVVLRLSCCTC